MSNAALLIVSPLDVSALTLDADGKPILSDAEELLDKVDDFNHPRIRRALILQQLRQIQKEGKHELDFCVSESSPEEDWKVVYESVHTKGLLDFLSTAWERWEASGKDPSGGLESVAGLVLVPSCQPLPRDVIQRPSKHPIGQMGYYCTDVVTPVFGSLLQELLADTAVVQTAVDAAVASPMPRAVYALPTHPGHHAAADSFGGYCYVNHVAAAARLLQTKLRSESNDQPRVAILDVDYHAGNGTASIFYKDPTVLVVSLHCDPDWDYPFHSGFADETGSGEGVGTTLHLPMPPGTTWESSYQQNLQDGLKAIKEFGPSAVLVSLGLDTHDKDPCAIRRAGFHLQGKDYRAMGRMIAEELPPRCPTIFLQEGGYRMDKIAEAASDVVTSFSQHRSVA